MTTNASVPKEKLSKTMKDAIAAIAEDPDGATVPVGGGYWHTNGNRADFSTKTVYALNDRGILERQYKAREAWRDTYKLSPKGWGIARKSAPTKPPSTETLKDRGAWP